MSTAPMQRIAWIDTAKGLCIALVVFMHVTKWCHPSAASAGDALTWLVVAELLRPLRMPLFFMISGLLAHRSLQRPWRNDLRGRALTPYYLFLLWTGIYLTINTRLTVPTGMFFASHHLGWWAALIPSSSLWFLLGLACYWLVARATSRLPAPAVVAAGFVLSIATVSLVPEYEIWWTKAGEYMVFYLIGARFPGLVARMANTPLTARATILAFAVYVAGIALWLFFTIPAGRPLAALPLCLLVVQALAHHSSEETTNEAPDHTGIVSRLGRHTLGIYLLHPVVFILCTTTLQHVGVSTLTNLPLADLWLIPTTTAVCIGGALGLHRALGSVAPWLFALPLSPWSTERRNDETPPTTRSTGFRTWISD